MSGCLIRIALLLIIGGGFLGFSGCREFMVSRNTGGVAEAVDLVELERGVTPENNYVRLGEHWQIYNGMVFSYRIPEAASSEEAQPEYDVTFAYYPIISNDHPFFAALETQVNRYGSPEAIPANEWPTIEDFKVIVKTRQFDTVGDLPDPGWETAEQVEGLIVNSIESLSDEEQALLQPNFPALDLSSVLILEEGRHPSSLRSVITRMALAGMLLFAGLAIVAFHYLSRWFSKNRT